MATAKLVNTVDLPSLGTELVTTTALYRTQKLQVSLKHLVRCAQGGRGES